MRKPAEITNALVAELGKANGLQRVARKIGELSETLAAGSARLSRGELAELQISLQKLSRTLFDVNRAVSRRIEALRADV